MGESIEESAIREVKEETGLDIINDFFDGKKGIFR
ncbi:NUDIX domain-containing protein [Romboutsia sp.]